MEHVPVFLITFLVWGLLILGISAIFMQKNKSSENDKHREKKYFGLKFWLITFFFFPFSLIYVVIKVVQYQNYQKSSTIEHQNDVNKYQALYYKELYEKQKRENERELKKELQEENNE